MGQDGFCAVWLMYPHRDPDNEKLCCKQRVPALQAMVMGWSRLWEHWGDCFRTLKVPGLCHI